MKTLIIGLLLVSFGILAAPLDDLRSTGAVITMKKLSPARIQPLREAEDRYLLDVGIQIKDQAQFDKVKSLLIPGNLAKFSGAKIYSMEDFLPPLAQALVNKVLLVKTWDTEVLSPYLEKPEYADDFQMRALVKNGLGSFSNCWNTTTQVERSSRPEWDNKVQFFWPGREEATYTIRDKDYTTKIALKDLKPGDVIMFSMNNRLNGENEVQHTAIFVSQDVLFEKTDGSDNDPWRLSLKDDVLKKYKRLLDKDFVVEYRRFNGKKMYPTHEIPTENDPAEVKLFKKFFPDVSPANLHYGCETGLGGGCDGVITVVQTALVKIGSSGKATLSADPELMKRLINLK